MKQTTLEEYLIDDTPQAVIVASDLKRSAVVIHLGHYLHEDDYEHLKYEVEQMLKTRMSNTVFYWHLGRLEEAGIIYKNGGRYALTDIGLKVLPHIEKPFDIVV